jgi:hypothetical protein
MICPLRFVGYASTVLIYCTVPSHAALAFQTTGKLHKMMKRKASATELEYQSPPQCGFKDVGSPRRDVDCETAKEKHFEAFACEDVYGGEVTIDESPAVLKDLLENLHSQIDLYPEKREMLDMLKGFSPCPLDDEALMLRFVRAEQYNTRLAAKRIIKHYEKKMELFGSEKLGTSISLDDLDHNDMRALRSGGFQFLPSLDRAGRVVIFERFQNLKYESPVNLFRTVWYVSMSLVEGSEQRSHLVVISFQNGPFSPDIFDRAVYKQTVNILVKLLPMKLAGFHFCFDDVRFRMVWGLTTIFIGKESKQRAIDHEGTPFECRYRLISYGINVVDLPMTVDGVENNSNFLRWIDEQQRCNRTRGLP